MLDMHWHVYVVYVHGGHCAITLSLALAFGHVHMLDVVYDRAGHCALTFQGLWH